MTIGKCHFGGVSLIGGWGAPNVGRPDRVVGGAGGTGDERIHPRQNEGARRLLNTLQGSGGRDGRGEAVCKEAVGEGCI